MQADQQVDVILNAIDGKKGRLCILHYSCDIPVQLVGGCQGQCQLTTVGVDDDVIDGSDSTHDKSVLDGKYTTKPAQ